MSDIKRVAVFTSGGDAPGMNAAIRAVVRTATYHHLHIYGINRGYCGMMEGDIIRLEARMVGNILHQGGTILKTARSEEFKTKEGRQRAYDSLVAHDIDALIAIGGNGSFMGAHLLEKEFGIPVIGVPGTIDNDLYGTDYTIGYDTAVNTAIEAADRIRDTADSHDRLFVIEVMGRQAGFIALNTGVGSGATSILVPERKTSINDLVALLKKGAKRNKLFSLVVVAEGNENGGAAEIAQQIQNKIEDYEVKVAIIGHLQRGGSPSGFDRVLASRLGFGAVEGLLNGEKGVMCGLLNNKITYTPLKKAIEKEKEPDLDLMRMAEILAL